MEDIQETVQLAVDEAIKNTINSGVSRDLNIRTGKLLDPREPERLDIDGNIDSVRRWIEKRKHMINSDKAVITVMRDALTIKFDEDPNNYYSTVINAELEISTEMKKLGINDGKYMTCFEMADRIKRLRSYFENRQQAMELVTTLRNFKAKVEKEVEASDDKRGNRREMLSQAVDSNLPKSFNVVVPIFKGQEKQTLEVEVEINAADLTCTLVSPSVDDAMTEQANAIIDSELAQIESLYKEIVVIEQ